MTSYLKIARFDHWIKQLFILPGVWLACVMTTVSGDSVWKLLLGLLATSAAASANYVINEWLDAEFDKYHPTKKNRTCVTESLSSKLVIVEYLIFAVVSLVVVSFVNVPTTLSVVALLAMGVLYNVKPFRTKDVPYLDVLSESVNNALRFAIGWFCVAPEFCPPFSFVMGYWMAGAFLMASKRFAEYRMIGDPKTASLYRKSFSGYTELSLLLSAVFYGFMSTFFCGVFLVKHKIELIIAVPFVCGLFCLYLRICFRPDSAAQKPEKLFREKGLMLYVAALIALIAVLYCVRIPQMDAFLRTDLMRIGLQS